MKRSALLLTLLLCGGAARAQQPAQAPAWDRVWCVSDRIGLQFEPNADPQLFDTRLVPEPFYDAECHVSIGDGAGNLLFYLEARRPPSLPSRLRNAFHQIMPGSEELEAMGSIANGAIVLPRPGSESLFDLFTLCTTRGGGAERLVIYRHAIDMSDGLGRVSDANRLVNDDPLTDKLAAVRHANGRDWWLVAHGYQTNEFHVYLLDASGSLKAQRQAIGRVHAGHNVRVGEMTFSPQGDRLGLVTGNGIVEVFRFDRCTGRFSDPVYLGVDNPPQDVPKSDFVAHYGCSFSPSGRFFYYSTIDRLFQIDLNATEPARSKEKIWEDPVALANTLAQHELGPDGRIYIARYNHRYLSAIEYPDRKGKNCRFVRDFLSLGGRQVKAGLPNFPNYRLGAWIVADAGRDTSVCAGQPIRLGSSAQAGLKYRWEPSAELDAPNAAQPTARPTATRTYTLTVEAAQGGKSGCAAPPAKAAVRVEVLPSTALQCREALAPPPASLNALTIYPNPASDFFYLSYDFQAPEQVLFEVRDTAGDRRYGATLSQSTGRLELDTTDWPPGVYLCTFRVGGRLFATAKLLVF